MSLLDELRRRNVIRMAGLYLVGAWLIVQVAGTLLPMFGAPAWLPRSIVLVLVIGFVPALVFAWVFELTPAGIKRDAEVPASESIAPQTARRMDRMIIAVLLLALGFFAVDRFVLAPRRDAALVAQTQRDTRSADGTGAVDRRSVAVLPFVNMSGDAANEYFSDGISEEILNVLASVPELKVAARTSSFSFKGKTLEVPAIARELQVRMVLEGSVRKAGDKVRITAQLIDAKTGYHVWSQTYDRKLEDIFAIQDEIARAIGAELKVKIVDAAPSARPLAGAGAVAARGTRDPRAHDLYLRGTALWHTRRPKELKQAIVLFEQATRADPGFARAYAGEALVYTILPNFSPDLGWTEAMARSDELALRALAMDPSLPEPYAALANNAFGRLQRDTSEALIRRAIALRPSFATGHQWLGLMLMASGDTRGALAELERASALDPRAPVIADNHAFGLLVLGRHREAAALCKASLVINPDFQGCLQYGGIAALLDGDLAGGAALIDRQAATQNPSARGEGSAIAAALGGRADKHALAVKLAALPSFSNVLPDSGNTLEDHVVAQVLVLLGEDELALDYMARLATAFGTTMDWAIRLPQMDRLRCDPRFRKIVATLRTTDPAARCTP
jgi:TolB-like protein/Tfp pilus assembly protein PilF